jgi:Mn-dependent DtxR family transcriptional regulator
MKAGYPCPGRMHVLPALRAMADDGVVRASTREIAAIAKCSHFTVREALADLERDDRITVVSRGGYGRRWAPGEYRVRA